WVNGSSFWKKNKSILTASWLFFWAINITLLVFFTPMYSKKARVESMSYLKGYSNIDYFLIDDYGSNVLRFPPVFYTGQWPSFDAIYKDITYKDFSEQRDWSKIENQPTFVLFYKPDNLESRVDSLRQLFPELVYETKIIPGFMDRMIHRINPINANEEIHIYRNKARITEKKKSR
ncbi:MAG: hypothetical protein Q7V19_07060, partial [Bacteroidales bacterium]|nr:hypothetical protein [Bacteroidales bacterium]